MGAAPQPDRLNVCKACFQVRTQDAAGAAAVGSFLIGTLHKIITITGITDPVAVKIRLSRIKVPRTIVTIRHIPVTIGIIMAGNGRIRINKIRTAVIITVLVACITDAVAVIVTLIVVPAIGTVVAGISDSVTVKITLIGVFISNTVIAIIDRAVPVSVNTCSVYVRVAVNSITAPVVIPVAVARISLIVFMSVFVFLPGIPVFRTVIAPVPDPVVISIPLAFIRDVRTIVTVIAVPVPIAVRVIEYQRIAIIGISASVIVCILITQITLPVAVGIRLIRVPAVGTVVTGIACSVTAQGIVTAGQAFFKVPVNDVLRQHAPENSDLVYAAGNAPLIGSPADTQRPAEPGMGNVEVGDFLDLNTVFVKPDTGAGGKRYCQMLPFIHIGISSMLVGAALSIASGVYIPCRNTAAIIIIDTPCAAGMIRMGAYEAGGHG
jgi:hypothetical protein